MTPETAQENPEAKLKVEMEKAAEEVRTKILESVKNEKGEVDAHQLLSGITAQVAMHVVEIERLVAITRELDKVLFNIINIVNSVGKKAIDHDTPASNEAL